MGLVARSRPVDLTLGSVRQSVYRFSRLPGNVWESMQAPIPAPLGNGLVEMRMRLRLGQLYLAKS